MGGNEIAVSRGKKLGGLIAGVVALVLVATGCSQAPAQQESTDEVRITVIRVIDGDTIVADVLGNRDHGAAAEHRHP